MCQPYGWSPICGKSTIPGVLFRAGLIGVLDLLSFLECYNIRRTKLPVEQYRRSIMHVNTVVFNSSPEGFMW